MFLHVWFRPPRHLIVLFLFVALLPSVLLMVFGWRLLQQDREIERQQADARREQAIDLIAATLEQGLVITEERLRARTDLEAIATTADSVVVVFERDEVLEFPEGRLLYVPEPPRLPEASRIALSRGEELEHREQDPLRAAAWFRNVARSQDAPVRTAALFALARNYRKLGRQEEALTTLGLITPVRVAAIDGVPADLAARTARCFLLEEMNRSADLMAQARELRAKLLARHWQLDRPTFELNLEQANSWAGDVRKPPSDSVAIAATVQRLWADWRSGRAATSRKAVAIGDSLFTVLSAGDGNRVVALVGGPRFAAAQWMSRIRLVEARSGLRVELQDSGVRSSTVPGSSRRPASDSGLPWNILAVATGAPPADALSGRHRLWATGLVVLATLVLFGTYVVGRAVSRELEVARLQSDFVAAVSHEFRTPLTSLRQLSEMLLDRPHAPDRTIAYYEVLQRQTERLHRLVESLLDFGRIEAGTSPYRLCRLDAAELVRKVVDDFRSDPASRHHRIEFEAVPAAWVCADADALSTALWNLLDNAAKYSPAADRIRVGIVVEGQEVVIRVSDEGFGIPAGERRAVFQKFVRGARAKAEGIKGTGVGLAIVQHIVSSHRGTVSVEGETDAGTVFAVRLARREPVLEEQACLES